MPKPKPEYLPLKLCICCGADIQYRTRETNAEYEKRKYCSLSCSNSFNNNRLGTHNKQTIWNMRWRDEF